MNGFYPSTPNVYYLDPKSDIFPPGLGFPLAFLALWVSSPPKIGVDHPADDASSLLVVKTMLFDDPLIRINGGY